MPSPSKLLLGLVLALFGGFVVLAGCLLLGGSLFLGLFQPSQGPGEPQTRPVERRSEDQDQTEPAGRRRGAEDRPEPVAGPVNPNVRFGMPAPAAHDPGSREAYLLDRPQYVLSYNAKTLIPNWVSWRLLKSDIGNVPRQPFEPDPDLPQNFPHVTSADYAGGGFDRGHQCPAKDRSATEADSKAVFYMTNILPQSPNSNQRGWERLEDYCRRLAQEGHALFICCGPAGVGGEGKDGRADEIGKRRHRITVPAKLWKVILVLPREDAEPRKNSRVISVVMPNDQSVDFNWGKYRVAAREVEKLTGYKFFRNVPEEIAQALRERVDEVEVPVAAPRRQGGDRER
jgi:endonuclease G